MGFWYDVFDGQNIYSALVDLLFSLVLPCVLPPPPTMRAHHVTGVFSGTFLITLSASSLSRSLLTLSSQWSGTGTGLWTATGLAPTFNIMGSGSPFIMGSTWRVHLLNAEEP